MARTIFSILYLASELTLLADFFSLFFGDFESFTAFEVNFRFLGWLDLEELGIFGIAISCCSCLIRDLTNLKTSERNDRWLLDRM